MNKKSSKSQFWSNIFVWNWEFCVENETKTFSICIENEAKIL